jgi:hypothetical protein
MQFILHRKQYTPVTKLYLLTLSDPMSDLVRYYDFPFSDAFLDL